MAHGYVAMVILLVIFAVVVQGQPRACTWADVEYCEEVLQTYTDDTRNWHSDPEIKSIFYCNFVELRLLCLQSLTCDRSRTTDDFPLNLDVWIGMIAPRLEMMANLGLCSQRARDPKPINYEDPCDEYYVTKRCMHVLSDYLKTPYAMTCVAMMKAAPCFKDERERCGIFDDALPAGTVNPYIMMVDTGHCRLAWKPTVLRAQELWRIKYGDDYFTFFG